ncbi:MAG: DNA polymerase, partial [Nitrososphaera sp.]
MNPCNLDVYVRAYAKPKVDSHAQANVPEKLSTIKSMECTRPSRILVFDSETTNDERQALKFGYFEIIQNGQPVFCALFYNENMFRDKELSILTEYCNANQIPLMTRKQFNDEVFYPEVFFKQTCCVGFNLPFDLSRIALDFGYARDRTMLGGFSFKLSTNIEYPRVLVKHVNNTIAFIKFSRSIIRYTNGFKGNFVDLRTLGWAIRNKKFSLDAACKEFNTEIQKKKARQHDKITAEYIDYCVNDVKATYTLFGAMLREYEKYDIDLDTSKAFSPSSIGKALLHKMGIAETSQKISQIPDNLLGYVMSAFYGGRSEVRIRKTCVPVVYMDFLSMYPTACILMELWKFITCHHVEYVDCTQEIIDFVDEITVERLRDREIWRDLTVIVEVEPHGDILPIRAKYDGQTQGIGINHLEGYGKRLWYTI